MAQLTLTGVSDDGRRLLLVDAQGTEHTLAITPPLRAALRGEGSRQMEISMESVLRPRDIQARIRAGESPESVASAAKTSVEQIMPFVGPVLAERAHVAQRAQRSTLRRRAGEPAPASAAPATRILGDTVEDHLRAANVDPGTVEWDAWRREDGRWALRATFAAGARAGTAEFTYDMPGSYVLLDNEEARWLVGEQLPAPAPAARDDLESARLRRQTGQAGQAGPGATASRPTLVSADSQPPLMEELDALGEDAIELVNEAADHPVGVGDSNVDGVDGVDRVDEEPGGVAEDGPLDSAETAERPAVPTEQPEPEARRPAKRKGRASVPSWDEIMFGGSDS